MITSFSTGRHAQGVDIRHFAGDIAHHHGRRGLLAEGADAKAADPGHGKSRVQFQRVFVFLLLLVGEDFVQQADDVVRVHRLLVDRHRGAVDLDVDGRADRQENVGGFFFGHQLEQPFHR